MTIKEAMGEFTWTEKGQDDNGAYFILTDSKRGFDYEVMLVKATKEIQVNGAYLKTVPRDIGEFVQMKMNQAMIYGKEGCDNPIAAEPNRKKPVEKTVKVTVKKPVTKKTETKKPAVKKEVEKKPAAKKEVEKKPAVKKAVAEKIVAKKAKEKKIENEKDEKKKTAKKEVVVDKGEKTKKGKK